MGIRDECIKLHTLVYCHPVKSANRMEGLLEFCYKLVKLIKPLKRLRIERLLTYFLIPRVALCTQYMN